MTDTTLTNVAGDFVRPTDADDFYGIVDSVTGDGNGSGNATIGGTAINNVDTSPSVGDYLIQADAFNGVSTGTVLATLDIDAPVGHIFSGLVSFAFTTDEDGNHEADDAIAFQIYDPIGAAVLNALTVSGDYSGDVAHLLTADVSGLSQVQARIVYVSGLNDNNADAEEVQISAYSLSADAIAVVPEPSAAGLTLVAIPAFVRFGRRGRRPSRVERR